MPRALAIAMAAAAISTLGAAARAEAPVIPATAKLPPPDYERKDGEEDRRRHFRQNPHVKWAMGRQYLRVCRAGKTEAEAECGWVRVRAH
jgi:hypothetical protein